MKILFGLLLSISTLVVIGGIFPQAYSYYLVLRLLLFLTCLLGGYCANLYLSKGFVVSSIVLALIYNPFLPVHLGIKEVWIALNILTVLFCGYVLLKTE